MLDCQECDRAERQKEERRDYQPILYLVAGLLLFSAGVIGLTYGFVYGWKSLDDQVHALVGSIGTVGLILALWRFLVPYVRRTVKGCYLYDYVNHRSEGHTHLTQPQYGFSDDYESNAKGPIFRIALGGWFKSSAVLHQPSGHWWHHLKRADGIQFQSGNSYSLSDPEGGRLPPMTLAELRWVVECFTGLRTLIEFARVVERQRDHLGGTACAVVRYAKDSKDREKSPTARSMRLMLEQGVRTVPAHRYGGSVDSSGLLASWEALATQMLPPDPANTSERATGS
ncbi:MAG: hypothetical protein WC497_03105 [Patescibacteria group bacterium]